MKAHVLLNGGTFDKNAEFRFDVVLGEDSFISRVDELIEFLFVNKQKLEVTIQMMDGYKSLGKHSFYSLSKDSVYDSIHFYTIRKDYLNVVFASQDLYAVISELTKLVRVDVFARLKEGADHEVA